MTKKSILIGLTIIIGIAISLLFFSVFESQVNFINVVGVYGSYLSIVGLAITLVQILDVKNENAKIADAVEQSKKMINDLQTVSNLPEIVSLLDNCKYYLRDKKNELAHLRMNDVKMKLVELKSNKEFYSLVDNMTYSELLKELSINMNNVNKQILGANSKNLRYDLLINNLEDISAYLNDIKSQLINKNR
jgi:nucleoside diphosphate kinase